jgi:hypothetical protein
MQSGRLAAAGPVKKRATEGHSSVFSVAFFERKPPRGVHATCVPSLRALP